MTLILIPQPLWCGIVFRLIQQRKRLLQERQQNGSAQQGKSLHDWEAAVEKSRALFSGTPGSAASCDVRPEFANHW
jgi:hypothetical protein